MAKRINSKYAWLIGIVSVAIILKAALLISGAFPFNSDEAVVALMGRHILAGERPIFFYGQAYMGSLDAYLVAILFGIFGQAVWVVRLVQVLLFVGTILSTFLLGKIIFKSNNAGLIAAALVAVPSVNVTLYTTVSLGGYGEALLLGNLILLTAIWLANRNATLCFQGFNTQGKNRISKALLKEIGEAYLPTLVFGFIIGLGLWTNGLTLVYSTPAFLYVFFKKWKNGSCRNWRYLVGRLLLIFAGLVVGSFPLWMYLFRTGPGSLLREYLGSAVAVETGSWLALAGNHSINFFLLGVTAFLGFRPPWTVTWLVLPLVPFVLMFWGWTVSYLIREMVNKREAWGEILLLTGVMTLLIAGFIGTPFGIDPSGRYFLPFGIILALAAAGRLNSLTIRKRKWKWGLVGLLLSFYFLGNLQCMLSAPQSFTTQFDSSTIIDHRYDAQLIQFLKDNDETRGYGNYWITYPLAFLSNEELIFTPHLPYHLDFRYTSRDDRYAPYDAMVADSERIAIITAHFEALDDKIRLTLISENVTWKEKLIGDYRIFYKLSRPIHPEEFTFINPG
jgi:4-amino-4-deoxy-L-arabinose transferase-like glycosyltransferase